MEQYISKTAVVAEIKKKLKYANDGITYAQSGVSHGLKEYNIDLNVWQHCQSMCKQILSFLDTLEVKEVDEKSKPAYGSKIIKVKCISPFDETWEKGKIYTGEKWHHGDLNMDFWDIYYDYGNNPKYVQFSSIEMLEKEFTILRNDILEVEEVDFKSEIKSWLSNSDITDTRYDDYDDRDIERTAKHFFELGMSVSNKAQKGEEV